MLSLTHINYLSGNECSCIVTKKNNNTGLQKPVLFKKREIVICMPCQINWEAHKPFNCHSNCMQIIFKWPPMRRGIKGVVYKPLLGGLLIIHVIHNKERTRRRGRDQVEREGWVFFLKKKGKTCRKEKCGNQKLKVLKTVWENSFVHLCCGCSLFKCTCRNTHTHTQFYSPVQPSSGNDKLWHHDCWNIQFQTIELCDYKIWGVTFLTQRALSLSLFLCFSLSLPGMQGWRWCRRKTGDVSLKLSYKRSNTQSYHHTFTLMYRQSQLHGAHTLCCRVQTTDIQTRTWLDHPYSHTFQPYISP